MPGFYDGIKPFTEAERRLYEDLDLDAPEALDTGGVASMYSAWSDEELKAIGLDLLAEDSGAAAAPVSASNPSQLKKRRRESEGGGKEEEEGGGGGGGAAAAAAAEPAASVPKMRRHNTRMLLLKWRLPALSVHSVTTSGRNSSVIPRQATGGVFFL